MVSNHVEFSPLDLQQYQEKRKHAKIAYLEKKLELLKKTNCLSSYMEVPKKSLLKASKGKEKQMIRWGTKYTPYRMCINTAPVTYKYRI